MAGPVAVMEVTRHAYRFLLRKPLGIRLLRRLRMISVDNIKMPFKEIDYDS
jgi:hypothetical protein